MLQHGICSELREFSGLTIKDAALAGGKGASLGEMTHCGMPVPPGFVILSTAFDRFMEQSGLPTAGGPGLRDKILHAAFPDDLAQAIMEKFRRLGARRVAVRSSATAEDSTGAAWAGQLETYLNTTEKNLLTNIKRCWASLFLPRAQAYREEKKFGRLKISVAVVIQQMVPSEQAGIAFSVHPVTQNRNQLIIEAIRGLGEAIVSGQVNPDSYVVDKTTLRVVERQVQGRAAILTDRDILRLARYLLRLERHYGYPVDMEWAQAQGRFYIVQSRPITTLTKPALPQKDAAHIRMLCKQWEPDLVCFNYPCLVLYSCLTWFWATDQAQTYYNATVPFFFSYLKDGAGNLESPWYRGPGETVMRALETNGRRWLQRNRRACARGERAILNWLKKHPVKPGASLQRQLAHLHQAVRILVANQIHFQVSTHIDRWLNPKLCTVFRQGGHTLSDQEIMALGVTDRKAGVAQHEEALEKLRAWCQQAQISLTADACKKNLRQRAFRQRLEQCYQLGYFLRSGYGGVEFWTLHDEYRQLAAPAARPAPPPPAAGHPRPRLTARQQFWLDVAQHFSACRDRRKGLQQRMFYRMALLLEHIGRRLGLRRAELEQLRIEEFTAKFLTGPDARRLMAARRHGYFGFWSPATGTWEWNGREAAAVYAGVAKKYRRQHDLRGNCACPGLARGKVRIVLNPHQPTRFRSGEVLVAGMTSPDYMPLMRKAAAVVTELGGITCHAAIISRELRKPCIIGTQIATKVLADGDLVEVDAVSGTVTILKKRT